MKPEQNPNQQQKDQPQLDQDPTNREVSKEQLRVKAEPDIAAKDISWQAIKSRASKFLYRFQWNTWYFTVLFFLSIFGASLWVWWSCFYEPKPSFEVVSRFEAGKENFESMKNETEETIEMMEKRDLKYEQGPGLGDQRELFFDFPADQQGEAFGENQALEGESEEGAGQPDQESLEQFGE